MKRSAHVIVLIAFGLAAVFVALGTLFVAGEILTDPGGWSGVGVVALWLIPVLVLSVAAWKWASVTTWVLAGLLVLIAVDEIVNWIWSAVNPSGWSEVFRPAPILGLGMLAVILPIAVLGLRRPAVAGAMLVGSAVVSYAAFVSTILGDKLTISSSLMTSRTVTILPMLFVGALYLLGAALGHGGGQAVASHASAERSSGRNPGVYGPDHFCPVGHPSLGESR